VFSALNFFGFIIVRNPDQYLGSGSPGQWTVESVNMDPNLGKQVVDPISLGGKYLCDAVVHWPKAELGFTYVDKSCRLAILHSLPD
jgi:hypothetical protein